MIYQIETFKTCQNSLAENIFWKFDKVKSNDVKIFLEVIQKLVDKGNTVLIIEHNMDVIKAADYIIDIGPEGGNQGGQILCNGTPEQIVKCKESHTAKYLKKELE